VVASSMVTRTTNRSKATARCTGLAEPHRHGQAQFAREARVTVRRGLEDLPAEVRSEMEDVRRILFEEFERTRTTATQPWKKGGRILKVLAYGGMLFGHAGSDVDEHAATNLLVVVNDKRLTSFADYWSPVADRLERERTIANTLRRNFSLIVYSLNEVNRHLEDGVRFFADVLSRGVSVYDDEGTQFAAPKRLPERQGKAAALAHFDFWYPRSVNARELAAHSMDAGILSDAAFLLHQATERAYHCVCLLLTLHSPKTHRLDLLRSNAEHFAPILVRVWPADSKFERRCFEKLRRAYVLGRYDPAYHVTLDELRWIDERVRQLQEFVRIERAIRKLPKVTRQVFAARRAGLEYEEIGEQLGLTAIDVERTVNRALDSIVRDLRRSKWSPTDPGTVSLLGTSR
jgi:uncharacterized protein